MSSVFDPNFKHTGLDRIGNIETFLAAIGGSQTVLASTPGTDIGPLIQAAYDKGFNHITLPAGISYAWNTAVYLDSSSPDEIVTIEGSGNNTITLGATLPTCSSFTDDPTVQWALFANTLRGAPVTSASAAAWQASTAYQSGNIARPSTANGFVYRAQGGATGSSEPTWPTTAGLTVTDGTVVWTCMGANSAVDCGAGTTQRNAASSISLPTHPKVVFRNVLFDGSNQNVGVFFGNGCTAGFEEVVGQRFKIGQTWTGYADGAYARHCESRVFPVAVGSISGNWWIYQQTNGDGVSTTNVKCVPGWGIHHATSCNGATHTAAVSGGFWFKSCLDVKVEGWHIEEDQSTAVNPACYLDCSTVNLDTTYWRPGLTTTSNGYMIEVNDSSTTPYDATHLTIENSGSQYNMSGGTADSARLPDIYVAAANAGFTLRYTASRAAVQAPSGSSSFPDAPIVTSAVPAITTALTAGAYGQQPAVMAGDWILRQIAGAWVVDAYQQLPGVRAYSAQAQPTLSAVNRSFTSLPTISSIVTNGSTWVLTFASNHGLPAGVQVVLAGFTPSGYNGTFTVASITPTTMTITNATQPGTVTVTGSSCQSTQVRGSLTVGGSYCYCVATVDDDGAISQFSTVRTNTANVTQVLSLVGTVSAPFTNLIVWRKAASSGVDTAPDSYQIVALSQPNFTIFDTGLNLNGRPWISTAVPVPSTSFATTTALAARQPVPIQGFSSWATGAAANLLNSSSGSSVTMVAGDLYWAALPVYFTSTITGVVIPAGSVGGTDKWIVAIYNAAGVLVANTALAGTTAPAATTKARIALTAPVTLPGPGLYFLALQSNGTTAKFLAFPNATEGFVTGHQSSGTFGTLPNPLTVGTSYVQNIGPMASTY